MATTLLDNVPYSAVDEPTVLVFGDDPDRRARLAHLFEHHGARIGASLPIVDAPERLRDQAAAALLAVDVVGDGGAALDELLEQIQYAGRRGWPATLVIATIGTVDLLAGRLFGSEVPVLIDPADDEIATAATALMAAPSPTPMFGDSAVEANSRRLSQLSEEVSRIARALAALSSSGGAAAPPNAPSKRDAAADLAMIRAILRMRRLRDQYVAPVLFADPAWDMLLDLAAAEIERRSVAVSSLCIAAAVPATTALRWIATMTEHGLLIRRPDPEDGRRVFVALSDAASTAMTAYLAAAAQVMRPAR